MENNDRGNLLALLSAVEDPARGGDLPTDDGLIAVARYHRLSPLLSTLAAATLPPSLAGIFRRDRLLTAARGLVLAGVAEECARALATDGVPAIVLKGLAYDQLLYGGGAARPTGDVDLLVPNEKRRLAFGVLDRLGFEPRASSPGFDDADYHEVAWTRAGVEMDLHMALTPFVRCRIDYDEIWAQARPLRLGQTEALALAPVHAIIFHALHMAIDHFAVPAVYLVDLSRLTAGVDLDEVEVKARAWHLGRPLATALALTATFLPGWGSRHPSALSNVPAPRVLEGYGPMTPLPRLEQLLRKLMHFDTVADIGRYATVQSRRILREGFERHVRKRSPRERLALVSRPRA